MNTKAIGNRGEDIAADYLLKHGYKILERQYRTKRGEIDIIGKKDNTIVFFEVKSRRSLKYGAPALAVDYRKQKKIVNSAVVYLEFNGGMNQQCRFDVIEVYFLPDGSNKVIQYENAFEA
ncbi:MAG: YraN family protein [Selenomonadaceae bacterium]